MNWAGLGDISAARSMWVVTKSARLGEPVALEHLQKAKAPLAGVAQPCSPLARSWLELGLIRGAFHGPPP